MRVVLFLCLSLLVAAQSHGEIGIGDARDDVLRQLGKPTSIARRGDHEIFLYPKGARIEFVDGKVTDVKGPLPPSIVLPPPAPAPTPPPVTEHANPEPRPATAAPAAPVKNAPTAKPVPAPSGDFNPAAMSEELAKHVEKMETPWGGTAPERQRFELLGPASRGFTTLVGVENGIPGLLLIFTINVFAGIAALNLIYD